MRVEVDRGKCIGNGMCVALAPDVFDIDDEGLVVLLHPDPPADRRDDVDAAVLNCPVEAIVTED